MTKELKSGSGRSRRLPGLLSILLLLSGLLSSHPLWGRDETDVRYASGSVELAALLLEPDSPDPTAELPAVVVVQGSGPSDRTNSWARAFADVAVEAGFAVLLTDKRGSGASGGDWRTTGLVERADDVLAGVRFLRSRAGIDPNRIGLLGLSQGGRVAPVAAARCDCVAFVIDVVGSAVTFAEDSFHEMRNTARQAGLDEAGVDAVLRLNAAAARYAMDGDWKPYGDLRDQALKSEIAEVARGFPASPDAPIWAFIRKSLFFDPIPYWLLVSQPVLVIYGAEDERDNVPVSESVRRLRFAFDGIGKRNHEILVVPGVGHSLRRPDGSLDPEVVDRLQGWLRENGGAR